MIQNSQTKKERLKILFSFSKVLRGNLRTVLKKLETEDEFDYEKIIKSNEEMARFAN